MAAALLGSAGALAQGVVIEPPGDEPDEAPLEWSPSVEVRALLALEPHECLERLSADARFEMAEGPDEGVAYVRLDGPLGGVTFEFEGRDGLHEVIDCRFAMVLRSFAPALRRERIRRVGHLSIYRPGAVVRGSHRESGHAHALAIDVRHLERDDGRVFDVASDWGDSTPDSAPCDAMLLDGPQTSPIRRVVCHAAAEGRFQIVVTPHRDAAHRDHVHLEVVPGVDWVYVR